jgi:hypothetical protein
MVAIRKDEAEDTTRKMRTRKKKWRIERPLHPSRVVLIDHTLHHHHHPPHAAHHRRGQDRHLDHTHPTPLDRVADQAAVMETIVYHQWHAIKAVMTVLVVVVVVVPTRDRGPGRRYLPRRWLQHTPDYTIRERNVIVMQVVVVVEVSVEVKAEVLIEITTEVK